MTKQEFYNKWKDGCKSQECMFNDLDKVVCAAVCEWKDFVNSECEKLVNLDKFIESEAMAIEKRNNRK